MNIEKDLFFQSNLITIEFLNALYSLLNLFFSIIIYYYYLVIIFKFAIFFQKIFEKLYICWHIIYVLST